MENILSMEMIAPQVNDSFPKLLEKYFKELIELYKKTNYKTPAAFMQSKEATNIITILEKATKDRLGIPIKIVNTDFDPIMCIPIQHISNSMLYKNYESVVSDMRSVLARYGEFVNDSNVLNNIKITLDSIQKLNTSLNNNPIKIDTKNAKIIGLADDIVSIVGINMYILVTLLKIDHIELTAAYLHELGHIFTILEYSNRFTANTSVLVDTIKSNLEKSGNNPSKAFRQVYKDLGGKLDINKLSDTSAFIHITNIYVNHIKDMVKDNTHSSIDTEMLADQFSTRFGYGSKLIKHLNYVDVTANKIKSELKQELLGISFYAVIFSLLSILVFGYIAIIGIISTVLFMVVMLVIKITIDIVVSIITKGKTNVDELYDTDFRRYKRIRNDLIRQIRIYDLPKQTIDTILNDIKNIDAIINMAEKKYLDVNMFDKLYRKISPTAKRILSIKETEQLIEDLMENEVHLAAIKLKTLKG